MNRPTLTLSIAFSIGIVFTPVVAFAQLPPGKDGYAWPPGAKAGQTVNVQLGGSDWTPDIQFFVSVKRMKFEQLGPPGDVLIPEPPFWFGIRSFDNDPRLPREVPVRLTIPTDMPAGPVRWRVANANGAAVGGLFMVGKGEEVIEEERRTKPQVLASLPVTINGRLRRIEEIDQYSFTASSNGLVTAELFARRLGNEFNGVIRVTSEGAVLAEAVDTVGIDPLVTFRTQAGKTYTLSVRDIDHRGYRNFTYRLALSTGPRIVAAIPATLRRGERRTVELIGEGLVTGEAKREKKTVEVEVPKNAGERFEVTLKTPHGEARYSLPVSDVVERVHADGATLPVPCAVTGRFEQRGQREFYSFAAKKGETWEIAVHAREIGSPVNATLVVISPEGKNLAVKIDAGGVADPSAIVTLPTDGECRILLGNVSGQTSNLDAIYRLSVRRPLDRVSLKIPSVFSVPIGGKASLPVDVVREGNFNGPVTLALAGLPEGVTGPRELIIPKGATSLAVALECAKTAAATTSFVTVTGQAKIDGNVTTVKANAGDNDSTMLLATTLTPPFKVKSPEADGTRKVFRGATHLADLVVERTDGFTGEIVLDMAGAQQRHRQGIRGPALTIAPGQTKVLYPVTLPECLETTRTSRIGLVALAKIADPKGTKRWVMAPMEGQVTMSVEGALMKLSAGAEELSAKAGKPVAIPLKLARSTKLAGPVKIEWIIPDDLKGIVTAAPRDWPGEKPAAEFSLSTKADPKLVGYKKLTARATATREGFPVVSETEIEIEFQSKK